MTTATAIQLIAADDTRENLSAWFYTLAMTSGLMCLMAAGLLRQIAHTTGRPSAYPTSTLAIGGAVVIAAAFYGKFLEPIAPMVVNVAFVVLSLGIALNWLFLQLARR